MRAALALCRRHLIAAALFSALVNLLYIAPTLFMLQVYDRVVPTQGLQTLLFLTIVLLFALATLSLLDRIRARLLVSAGVQLDTTLAPLILDATLGRPDLPVARQALREFDTMRATLSGQGILALFDAPWVPIYILVCFLVHPWIGLVAIIGCTILPLIAWANERATRGRLDRAQAVASASYANQDVVLGSADAVRALGMRRAMVARQLRQRGAMMMAQTQANFAAGGFLTATKFVRLALQSLALGLGAWLAVDNQISGGAIFASSFLIARALAPIEQLIGTWKPIVQARQSYASLDALLSATPVHAIATAIAGTARRTGAGGRHGPERCARWRDPATLFRSPLGRGRWWRSSGRAARASRRSFVPSPARSWPIAVPSGSTGRTRVTGIRSASRSISAIFPRTPCSFRARSPRISRVSPASWMRIVPRSTLR